MVLLFFLSALCRSYDEPFETVLLHNGDDGSKFYRIPGIIVADNGTIIAVVDKRWLSYNDLPGKIHIVIKKSYDHGKTWTPSVTLAGTANVNIGYGDASLVKDRKTGAILCIFNGNEGLYSSTAEKPMRNYYVISYDNGETWSSKIDITPQLYGAECAHEERKTWKAMFLSSGVSHQTRSGRIMVVGVVKKGDGSGFYNYVVYTDDLGKTWDISEGYSVPNGDESKVIELNNGSILMSIRKPYNRWFSTSMDKGQHWQPYINRLDMVDPGCNGDIIRYTSVLDGYDKNRIIHTNLHSTPAQGRYNLTIKLSYDEGTTFEVVKVLHAGKCQYSSASIDIDGSIVVYYEDDSDGDFKMTFARFSLEWLTDGKDKYTPPKKVNLN